MTTSTKLKRAETQDDDRPEQPLSDADQEFIRALATQQYHSRPSHSWCQDWSLYIRNNHPILSLCFAHALHPVSLSMRLTALLGSIVTGLAITNIVWLLFIYDDDKNGGFALQVSAGGVEWNNQTVFDVLDDHQTVQDVTTVQVNTGMLVLWTAGAALHSMVDATIWSVTSGACCSNDSYWFLKPEYQRYGNFFVVILVLLLTAFATLIVVCRVTLNDEEGDGSSFQDLTNVLRNHNATELYDIEHVKDASNYEFLLSYAVELAMAWILYFPLTTTIAFSGILSCFKPIWCLGGRVYEIEKAKREENAAAESALDSNNV